MSTPYGGNPDPAGPPNEPYPQYGGGYGDGYGGGAASTWEVSRERNRVAPWALVVGVLAALGAVSVFATSLAGVIGVIGVILAVVALAKGRRIHGPGRRTGMAVTGLIFSLVAIALSVIFWVVAVTFLRETSAMECFQMTDPADQQECLLNELESWLDRRMQG